MEAHPAAMPPDTESDEEHEATEAYPESPGETHTHPEERQASTSTKGEQPHAQSARHAEHTCEHANRHDKRRSRWMHSLAHVHTDWHSIKSIGANRPAAPPWHGSSLSHQTCNGTLRNKPSTRSIFSLFRSYLIFIHPYVAVGLTSLLPQPRRHYRETGLNENNIKFIHRVEKTRKMPFQLVCLSFSAAFFENVGLKEV